MQQYISYFNNFDNPNHFTYFIKFSYSNYFDFLVIAFLKIKNKVKLIVIDSIAFHFRQDLQDTPTRSR